MAVNIEAIKALEDVKAPVYMHYKGQFQPQEAYIQMTEDGTISADYSSVVGDGMPSDVWHQHTLRFPIHSNVTGNTILDFVNEYMEEFEAIHAGHHVEWDGNNWRGYLTETANDARLLLGQMALGIDPDFMVYDDPDEWFCDENFTTGRWVDAFHSGTLRAEIEDEMKHTDSDIYLAFSVDDAFEYIENSIKEKLEEVEEA